MTYRQIWDNHPYPGFPCDKSIHKNQCAVRMGIALEGAGVSLKSFMGQRCWSGHEPSHILRAEELARWIATQKAIFGSVVKCVGKGKASSADFARKSGIVFIKDGWGAGDHIDVWDGFTFKAGDASWFGLGRQVWFWRL